jgi:hypothetical protein
MQTYLVYVYVYHKVAIYHIKTEDKIHTTQKAH